MLLTLRLRVGLSPLHLKEKFPMWFQHILWKESRIVSTVSALYYYYQGVSIAITYVEIILIVFKFYICHL